MSNITLSEESAEVLPFRGIRETACFFREKGLIPQLLDLLREAVIVTNSDRQIVYANRAALKFTAANHTDDLIGLLPGEAFQCVHATESSGCCGSAKYCTTCGSMFSLLSDKPESRDFSLSQRIGNQTESLDLNISACHIETEGSSSFFSQ